MYKLGSLNQTFFANEIIDHSFSLLKWKNWEISILVLFLTICTIVAIVGQTMVIHYIQKYAPKQRPINRIILVDQVKTKKFRPTLIRE